jgi:Zn-dependent peptidase ImmA (M78 family)
MGVKIINDNKLLEMHNEGKPQKEIAAYFGVSPVAVCRRLKRLLPVPDILDKYNLTDAQKSFVVEKAKGKTNTQAALESYETTSRKSAKVIGSQLMDNPTVKMGLNTTF